MSMPHIEASCPKTCVCYEGEDGCVCIPAECALRAWATRGNRYNMPPMTTEQREECLSEIGAVEGYDRKDYEQAGDTELACGVLQAWTDYCRDIGLL